MKGSDGQKREGRGAHEKNAKEMNFEKEKKRTLHAALSLYVKEPFDDFREEPSPFFLFEATHVRFHGFLFFFFPSCLFLESACIPMYAA